MHPAEPCQRQKLHAGGDPLARMPASRWGRDGHTRSRASGWSTAYTPAMQPTAASTAPEPNPSGNPGSPPIAQSSPRWNFEPVTDPRNYPKATIPFIRTNLPDGSIILRPGRPIVGDCYITTLEASRLLGMSCNWVIAQCESGLFATAFKPNSCPKSHWRISRSEVLSRLPEGQS
jgi:hypothetical protein